MARFLIILVILIALLALIFGPGLYRGVQFRRSQSQMLEEVRQGHLSSVVGFITPSQQLVAQELFTRHLPANYQDSIESLRLTSWHKLEDKTILAIVTCRLSHAGAAGIYQGKLLWRFEGNRWFWDFAGSSAAEFTLSGEPDWFKLSDVIPLAEQL